MALHVLDEANRCLGCKKPMCQEGCPIHTNIPEVIRLLKDNKLDEAGRMLFENNPLTTVCSLVCNHEKQCEGHCVRAIKGAPVHFSVIENYISSTYASQMTQGPAPSNGKKAAIIGSGPAGLTIAVILARYGYDVTIFESHDKIGGVLRYGIPDFRLPKSILDRYQQRLLELGVRIRPNTTIGGALRMDDLFRDGYSAVFIGTYLCLSFQVPGLHGINASDFLCPCRPGGCGRPLSGSYSRPGDFFVAQRGQGVHKLFVTLNVDFYAHRPS